MILFKSQKLHESISLPTTQTDWGKYENKATASSKIINRVFQK
jgi:hypothetical protein